MFLLVLSISVSAFSGNGSESNPYQIETCLELQDNTTDLTAYYILANDIDCSDSINWNGGLGFNPIGGTWKGDFNGNGKIISNFFINSTGNAGLFDSSSQSDSDFNIYNFTIDNAYIRSTGRAGAVMGYLYVRNIFDHVFSDITVQNSEIYGSTMGGLIGQVTSYGVSTTNVNLRIFNITIDDVKIGSLNDSCIAVIDSTDCRSSMGNYAGGLIGYIYTQGYGDTEIKDIYIYANVTSGNSVGGFVGRWDIGEPTYYAFQHVDVNKIYVNGKVYGAYDVGGIIGLVYQRGINTAGTPRAYYKLYDVSQHSSVYGSHDIGGVIGRMYGQGVNGLSRFDVQRTYSTGLVQEIDVYLESNADIGGWGGNRTYDNPIIDSFWDINTSNQLTSDGAIGLTSSQMKSNETWENYSITIWNITVGFYPYLSFKPYSCDNTLWYCSSYGSCDILDLSPCDSTIDSNNCGRTYIGDYSEFTPQPCNYCSADWLRDSQECINDTRLINWTDLNFATCCNITGLSSDCDNPNPSSEVCSVFEYSEGDIGSALYDTIMVFIIIFGQFIGALILLLIIIYLLIRISPNIFNKKK